MLIKEEAARDPEVEVILLHGWVYKKAEELRDELMLVKVSAQTVRRRVDDLVEQGWLLKRSNPHNSWDKTPQYRPDILKLQYELYLLGFALDGYPLLISPEKKTSETTAKEEASASATLDAPGGAMTVSAAGSSLSGRVSSFLGPY